MAQQPLVGQGLLIVEASGSPSDTTHGMIPLDDRSARRRDLYLTTLTRDSHACPRRESYPHHNKRPKTPRFRPRGHWDRLSVHLFALLFILILLALLLALILFIFPFWAWLLPSLDFISLLSLYTCSVFVIDNWDDN
jgi:hypothetical protein